MSDDKKDKPDQVAQIVKLYPKGAKHPPIKEVIGGIRSVVCQILMTHKTSEDWERNPFGVEARESRNTDTNDPQKIIIASHRIACFAVVIMGKEIPVHFKSEMAANFLLEFSYEVSCWEEDGVPAPEEFDSSKFSSWAGGMTREDEYTFYMGMLLSFEPANESVIKVISALEALGLTPKQWVADFVSLNIDFDPKSPFNRLSNDEDLTDEDTLA